MTPDLWLNVAGMVKGTREVVGKGSNPLILQWARDIAAPAWYDDDDKAWCAVLVNKVHQVCGLPLAGSGYDLLRAKSFLSWGDPLSTPLWGCVMVFTRDGGRHVGWLVGQSPTAYLIRGGNQGNAISDVWIARERLAMARWPTGVPLGGPAPTLVTPKTPTSRDEA